MVISIHVLLRVLLLLPLLLLFLLSEDFPISTCWWPCPTRACSVNAPDRCIMKPVHRILRVLLLILFLCQHFPHPTATPLSNFLNWFPNVFVTDLNTTFLMDFQTYIQMDFANRMVYDHSLACFSHHFLSPKHSFVLTPQSFTVHSRMFLKCWAIFVSTSRMQH